MFIRQSVFLLFAAAILEIASSNLSLKRRDNDLILSAVTAHAELDEYVAVSIAKRRLLDETTAEDDTNTNTETETDTDDDEETNDTEQDDTNDTDMDTQDDTDADINDENDDTNDEDDEDPETDDTNDDDDDDTNDDNEDADDADDIDGDDEDDTDDNDTDDGDDDNEADDADDYQEDADDDDNDDDNNISAGDDDSQADSTSNDSVSSSESNDDDNVKEGKVPRGLDDGTVEVDSDAIFDNNREGFQSSFNFKTQQGTSNTIGLLLGIVALMVVVLAGGVWCYHKRNKALRVVTFDIDEGMDVYDQDVEMAEHALPQNTSSTR